MDWELFFLKILKEKNMSSLMPTEYSHNPNVTIVQLEEKWSGLFVTFALILLEKNLQSVLIITHSGGYSD